MTDTRLSAQQMNDILEAATGRRLPYIVCDVVLDDGRRFITSADQRDLRRAQVAGLSVDLDPIGYNAYVAWSYLQRTGELDMGWPEFERLASWVLPVPDAPDGADPTGTATAG